jgi:hypothetical protein
MYFFSVESIVEENMALHVEVTPATQETPGKIKNPLAEPLLLNIEIDTVVY